MNAVIDQLLDPINLGSAHLEEFAKKGSPIATMNRISALLETVELYGDIFKITAKCYQEFTIGNPVCCVKYETGDSIGLTCNSILRGCSSGQLESLANAFLKSHYGLKVVSITSSVSGLEVEVGEITLIHSVANDANQHINTGKASELVGNHVKTQRCQECSNFAKKEDKVPSKHSTTNTCGDVHPILGVTNGKIAAQQTLPYMRQLTRCIEERRLQLEQNQLASNHKSADITIPSPLKDVDRSYSGARNVAKQQVDLPEKGQANWRSSDRRDIMKQLAIEAKQFIGKRRFLLEQKQKTANGSNATSSIKDAKTRAEQADFRATGGIECMSRKEIMKRIAKEASQVVDKRRMYLEQQQQKSHTRTVSLAKDKDAENNMSVPPMFATVKVPADYYVGDWIECPEQEDFARYEEKMDGEFTEAGLVECQLHFISHTEFTDIIYKSQGTCYN